MVCLEYPNKNYIISDEQKKIIEKIKNYLKYNVDNPKLKIESINVNNKNIFIIQDGYLMAGTKQRVAKKFIKQILKKNNKIDTLLYAGTANGFGAIATAYAAYKLGLKSEVFLSGSNEFNTRQINTLCALNSKITLCNSFQEARDKEYSVCNNISFKTSSNINSKTKWKTYPNYYIVPMGINDEEKIMINILSKQIKNASKGTVLDNIINPRIWLVAGSGGIAMSISNAFPNAKLYILLTGGIKYKKKIIEWSKKEKNIIILNNEKELNNLNNSNRIKYYSSVKNYDDLIWPYIKKYGLNNDFIWNVSSDDYLYINF